MTKTRFNAALLVALLVATAPTPAVAQVVYSGGAPNGQAGFDIFNDFRSADDMSLTGAINFNLIRFWGMLPANSTYVPTIFWQFLSGAGNVPGTTVVAEGTTLAERTLRTSLPEFGFDSWQFDLAVASQSLSPGIYWLALHDGAVGDNTDSTLLWEMTNAGGGSQFAVGFVPTNEWAGDWGGNLAFEVRNNELPVNPVPEPGTMMLLGTGMAGLAGMARRRFRA